MERVYCDNIWNPKDEDANQLLLNLMSSYRRAKEKFNEEDLKIYSIAFHDAIRVSLEMPNKLFAFLTNEDNTKAQIAFFPKEPDGNSYQPFYDEELKRIYILV
jgi:hypothetical protein